MSCDTCRGGLYPHYGVGPHKCFYKIDGAVMGESVQLPVDRFPNFVEDEEAPGLGVWLCPDCLSK